MPHKFTIHNQATTKDSKLGRTKQVCRLKTAANTLLIDADTNKPVISGYQDSGAAGCVTPSFHHVSANPSNAMAALHEYSTLAP